MKKNKLMIQALNGQKTKRPPFWLMRQAGRYLPEYQETRKKAGGFMKLCLTPDYAAEVTLQPIRRFDFDAAILFSDILMVPYGLGLKVDFIEGEGPIVQGFQGSIDENLIEKIHERLNPIYETVKILSKELSDEKTLIGFAGGPWTVATYVIEGKSSKDHMKAKLMMYQDEIAFEKLIDVLTKATIAYLLKQIEAGAEVIQLFESWGGILAAESFEKYVIIPTQKIVSAIKKIYPDILVIGFPRKAGHLIESYLEKTGVDAISLDESVPLITARKLQKIKPIQGLLDPVLMMRGGEPMVDEVRRMIAELSDGPYIFNLGHGILRWTNPKDVHLLAETIHSL